MSDERKFVAVIDNTTKKTFYVLMTAKQEAELTPAAPTPAPYSPPPAGDLPVTGC